MRYVHTNIIADDWRSLSLFYQRVFGCKPVPPQRDLKGEWLDRLTGLNNVRITGEHLALPGYSGSLPTLEIFSYDCGAREGDKHIAAPLDINKNKEEEAAGNSALRDHRITCEKRNCYINRAGLAHIAFEVSDIEASMELILREGGGQLGEIVSAEYPGGVTASFVYATDLEGNIIELQSWSKQEK